MGRRIGPEALLYVNQVSTQSIPKSKVEPRLQHANIAPLTGEQYWRAVVLSYPTSNRVDISVFALKGILLNDGNCPASRRRALTGEIA